MDTNNLILCPECNSKVSSYRTVVINIELIKCNDDKVKRCKFERYYNVEKKEFINPVQTKKNKRKK